ncbi:MAG: cysteine--tRNA ligase, partial [Anaerolineaceae bacterium]|nr:cysteine--tRNA ligase [Anaerolineaceae bacterium]
MPIQICSTLSRQKEPFETLDPDRVRMYVCAPTVYNEAHLGHAMSTMIFDAIRRDLEYRSCPVIH